MKAVIIVAYQDFKDEECFIPKKILEESGVEIKIVSDKLGTAIGVSGGELKVDIQLSDLDISEFDAVVFIGGPGALEHLDNENSYKIIRDTMVINKILAAICISPIILVKAGVLKNKKATVWTSEMDKRPQRALEEYSAKYINKDVVVDGNIITANGPNAAEEFGKTIVSHLR